MDSLLKKRIFPNHSIKLRPPTPHAPHQHICDCQMCKIFQHKKTIQLLSSQQQDYKIKLSSKLETDFVSSSLNCNPQAFQWVINRLILPNHKMITRGIDLFIPETVFYRDGEVSGLYKNREIDDNRVRKIRKQKINQTYLQKILNQRRRKYRDQIQVLLGEKVVQKKKALFGKKQTRIDTKDAAVLQYIDHSEQLITQNQLINLLLKRKQDGIWKKITMIKNFITCRQLISIESTQCFRQSSRVVKLSFQHSTPLYPQLFDRSSKLMLVYGENVLPQQKEYISEQVERAFCKQLLQKSVQVFAEYCLYKMVNFIEYFYDDRIQQIDCTILVNELNKPYLIDVFHLQIMQLVKYNWTLKDYKLKIQAQENKIFKNHKEIQSNPQTIANSNNIEDVMRNAYLKQKDNYGLTLDPQDTTEDQFNDKFFSLLYPDFKLNLSTVLKNQQISVNDFKKKFLNFKPQKKPIVKPFSSSLVKTLHILTPSIKTSPQKRIPNSTTKNQQILPLKTFRSRRFSIPVTVEMRFRSANKTASDFYF